MASSDIIKIGFDYRSSLAQFEKETNGVFDGISSKAGKQKITIQLDAKDDKVINKIKELQKLKLDKFTFEFGNSGLKEQLQTFDKLENKINEIINLGKGKSIIDSSSTIKEIDKINKSLNKTSEILNKSFSTKNKTEAFNQLKEASVAYEKFYGNEKAMATQEGTQAAYNYYKAYEEALKKGVAQTRLEKVTIDVEKGYNFNSSDLSSRRIKEFENYQKYGGDLSDLSLEIASLDGKLKDFSSAYAEVKKNLGEAPITPEIISNIEHYVELLDNVRYLKSWNKSDDKDIIAQDESSAKYFLDSAIYKAQEQNYNYTDSLKTQEIQAIATAEAEKKLAETQKEVSFTSSETNISSDSASLINDQNNYQKELSETKKLTDDNVSSMFEFIKLCQEQAKALGETNEELKERAAYFKDEKISGGVSVGTHYAGNHDNSDINGANSDLHSHFSKYASFSENDLFNLKDTIKNFMVMGTNELTHFDTSGLSKDLLEQIWLRYDAAIKELNQQYFDNLNIKNNLKFTDIEDIPERILDKAFEFAENQSNIDYDYDKYDVFYNNQIEKIRQKLLEGASLNDITNSISDDIKSFDINGVESEIKTFQEKFTEGIRGYLTNILLENDVFNPDKLLGMQDYNIARNNSLKSVLDELNAGSDRLKTIDISNLEEGYSSLLKILGLVVDKQKEVASTDSTDQRKDAFPKTDSSATNASTSAIKEENNALEQTNQSAEKAANSKKKFANANKEVKDSANASVGAIKDENNAFDKNEWDKNVKAIQKYMDAVTELNHLKAKDKGTGKNTSVIADQEQEVERLKNIAYEAKKTLSSIANSNKADVNTWEKWVNVMKQFDQASQGSTRSIARLEDAMRNANNSQIEYMNSVIKRFQNSYDKYSTDASRNGYNPSVEFSDKLSSFNSSLNDLKNLSSSISNGEFVKQEQIDSFKRLTQNAEEAQKSLKNMSASEKGMKSVSVQKEIDKINQLLRENTRYSKEAKIELRSLITQLMSGDPTVNLEAIHTKVMEIKNAEELAGRAGKNFFDILASKSYYGFIGQMQSYLSMYVGFYGMMNSFRNGLSTVRELNTALTEMRKVSEETTQSLKNYQNTTFDVANVVGTTAKQIQNSTADWMRLGESMSEAAESAKDANILFNVSEFEGIDEATESLVSMSQAYKDLDKMDIINVLNNIGNNYSISTDGLATALKDSASALVTANNDLNEAVSLTTAGNAITQDPSKVGAGLRTISLRLVGTEEAKQELSDLGEETDGMITTVSKLRDTIMDATKAASADGKGFDILDDNGNYKSTYEIMQGLADLYDDIVKKDKELGTNNLNLLLETIAGKNRSNIAASILQNGEMLKSVYEDAQNSEGSAEQELNSYLDSVDGKLQQLSNRAQEFWFKVIDSETIKNGIDLLTNLTKGATDFVDTIGILPTLLTGIGAGIAVKNVGEHYIVPVSI